MCVAPSWRRLLLAGKAGHVGKGSAFFSASRLSSSCQRADDEKDRCVRVRRRRRRLAGWLPPSKRSSDSGAGFTHFAALKPLPSPILN